VIAKARFQSIHFALVNVIHAQFVNMICRIGAVNGVEAEHRRSAAKKR
jgi:hypothetical protein